MRRRTVLSWVLGYYVLEMPREACETFMNMCMRYGFEHYGIEFDDERGKVYFTMPSSGRRKVLAACRVWRISVRVRQRRGLLALLSKYRGRSAFRRYPTLTVYSKSTAIAPRDFTAPLCAVISDRLSESMR